MQRVALGDSAAQKATTTNNIIAIGNKALLNNTVGHRLIAIGDSALNKFNSAATFVSGNVAIGFMSQYANDTGYSNTGVGHRTLQNNKANFNTGIGTSSMRSNTSGLQNTAVGANSLVTNTSEIRILHWGHITWPLTIREIQIRLSEIWRCDTITQAITM
ncbi:MAG: hypothetical protein HWD58_10220 [Bacteroidota bacterium]|nr:MAG: hypothetical protein HWD58_10220 [Bacteroidota bacterium]